MVLLNETQDVTLSNRLNIISIGEAQDITLSERQTLSLSAAQDTIILPERVDVEKGEKECLVLGERQDAFFLEGDTITSANSVGTNITIDDTTFSGYYVSLL